MDILLTNQPSLTDLKMPKIPFVDPSLLRALRVVKKGGITTTSRASTILECMVGKKFFVHNGKDYLPVIVTEEMVGHKLGEFVFTKKIPEFKRAKNREAAKLAAARAARGG